MNVNLSLWTSRKIMVNDDHGMVGGQLYRLANDVARKDTVWGCSMPSPT